MFDFKRRVLLVTGAGGGIGSATAAYFHACGARVMIGDINETAATNVARSLDPTGKRVQAMRYDASRSQDAQALVDACMQQFGRLDYLVPAAAIYEDQLVRTMTDAQWEATIGVNLNGVFYLVRQAAAVMHKGGAIVNLASQAGHTGGGVEHAHYGATKGALLSFTRTLARELGPRGIRVNAIVPGAIVTERQNTLHRDAAADQAFLDAQCLKIRLDPGHVARATLFLAADDSDGMTGQHVLVDAGIAQQSVIT